MKTSPRTLLVAGMGVVLILAALVWLVYLRSARPPFVPVFADERDAVQPAAWTVEVTYIANMGVMIASGRTRVLIDGLFRQYETYPYLPQPHRDQLESAAAPFHDIDLVLVSHVHGDHFHPQSALRYLQASPGTQLVSSPQVVDEIRAQEEYATIASRVTTVTPRLAERVSMTAYDVQLEVLGLGHGNHQRIQNLGYVLTVGGKRFLHVGDASATEDIFGPLNLDEAGIDVAFLPAWFLTEGATVVRDHIRPKHIVAVHGPPVLSERWTQALQVFPTASAFTKLLEKRYY